MSEDTTPGGTSRPPIIEIRRETDRVSFCVCITEKKFKVSVEIPASVDVETRKEFVSLWLDNLDQVLEKSGQKQPKN